jgi:hypothetical protein
MFSKSKIKQSDDPFGVSPKTKHSAVPREMYGASSKSNVFANSSENSSKNDQDPFGVSNKGNVSSKAKGNQDVFSSVFVKNTHDSHSPKPKSSDESSKQKRLDDDPFGFSGKASQDPFKSVSKPISQHSSDKIRPIDDDPFRFNSKQKTSEQINASVQVKTSQDSFNPRRFASPEDPFNSTPRKNERKK